MNRLLAPFLGSVLLVAGCSSTAVTSRSSRGDRPPCCREPLPGTASAPMPSGSLYQLESDWTSDQGRRIRLSQLRGRHQVVALFFSNCEYACPVIVGDMRRIQAALPEPVREDVDFLLVSLDPERDTPERLRQFRSERGLPTAHWTLLHGREDDVRELAAVLGIQYRKDSRGQFAHSNVITLLSPDGEVVARQRGLYQDPSDLVRQVRPSAK